MNHLDDLENALWEAHAYATRTAANIEAQELQVRALTRAGIPEYSLSRSDGHIPSVSLGVQEQRRSQDTANVEYGAIQIFRICCLRLKNEAGRIFYGESYRYLKTFCAICF